MKGIARGCVCILYRGEFYQRTSEQRLAIHLLFVPVGGGGAGHRWAPVALTTRPFRAVRKHSL